MEDTFLALKKEEADYRCYKAVWGLEGLDHGGHICSLQVLKEEPVKALEYSLQVLMAVLVRVLYCSLLPPMEDPGIFFYSRPGPTAVLATVCGYCMLELMDSSRNQQDR